MWKVTQVARLTFRHATLNVAVYIKQCLHIALQVSHVNFCNGTLQYLIIVLQTDLL